MNAGLKSNGEGVLAPYQYRPLTDPAKDIRIIKLHPGRGDNPLNLEIIETPLVHGSARRLPDIDPSELEAIQETLPSPWEVRQNEEGRLIYVNFGKRQGRDHLFTSWTHPTRPDVDSLKDDQDHGAGANSPYEALSYTWGDEFEPETATVGDGISSTRFQFQISKRLAEALRHLRRSDTPRNLWVDAICINQSDVEERNGQVRRMGDIFTQARRVVAWIGPSYEGSQEALGTLEYIGNQIQMLKKKKLLPSPGCAHPDWWRSHVSLPYGADTIGGIYRLLQSSWFQRMWVVQEIVLGSASSVIKCGDDEVRWPDFRRGLDILMQKYSGSRSGVVPATALCGHRPRKLDELLFLFHDRLCSDDRDRIYALLQLAPPRIAQQVLVDYTLPALEIYKRATLAYIDTTQVLDILRQTPFNLKSTGGVLDHPSWVMDWSQKAAMRGSPNKGFSAGGFSSSRSRYLAPDRLEISGVLVGPVLSSEKLQALSFGHIIDFLKRLGMDVLQSSPYCTEETKLRAYLLTLFEDDVSGGYIRPKSRKPNVAALEEEIITVAADGGEVSEQILRPRSSSVLVRTCRWASTFALDNDHKHIGKCQVSPKEGDVVFVPLGCEAPLLLRPDKNGHYRLLAECYVHGIMFGEAVLGPLPPGWSAKRHQEITDSFRTCFQRADADGNYTLKDPRLKGVPMPEGWEQIRDMKEETLDDPRNFVGEFRHRTTGETIKGDPRLLPEALAARGVPITTITLV
ncbi:heterokaryon incompatibility protein-domain-containing protein [Cladorrhinum sp. PSN332]|nr:heterokaryon incompatibility protein-domain-containing protein [Cladorrhinum sp. PSN332]